NEHLPLGGQNLRHRAPHEDHLEVVRRRQVFEQRRYKLHNSSSRIYKPRLVILDLFHALKLEVAFWIVFVWGSYTVSQRFESARHFLEYHPREWVDRSSPKQKCTMPLSGRDGGYWSCILSPFLQFCLGRVRVQPTPGAHRDFPFFLFFSRLATRG